MQATIHMDRIASAEAERAQHLENAMVIMPLPRPCTTRRRPTLPTDDPHPPSARRARAGSRWGSAGFMCGGSAAVTPIMQTTNTAISRNGALRR
jgi:hypothetical protein